MSTVCFLCRPGFEEVLYEEISSFGSVSQKSKGIGWLVLEGEGAQKAFQFGLIHIVFARQMFTVARDIEKLNTGNRFGPIYENILSICYNLNKNELIKSELNTVVHCPDTNEGRSLSPLARSCQKYLDSQKIKNSIDLVTPSHLFHVLFLTTNHVLIGWSHIDQSSPLPGGILRSSTGGAKVSRSARKLAEALEFFIDNKLPQKSSKGGTCVDLGAAPGGWTAHMSSLGFKVWAVDNGALHKSLNVLPNIRHLQEDAYDFNISHSVDILLCDMVDKPKKVAHLIAKWFLNNKCKMAIVNFKLPMKKKYQTWLECKTILKKALPHGAIQAKHLYHDREELTCFIKI